MNWSELFAIHMPVGELVIRGTVIYWFLFLVFRFVLRRDTGSLGIADVLFVALVADAAQNGMAGDYKTITEGLILLGTIVFWNWTLDFLAYRFRRFTFLTEPPPLLLIKNGRFIHRNLRAAFLTPTEVMSSLREHEVAHLRQVAHAYLESSGAISVMKVDT